MTRGDKPVTDLQPEDFELFEDGKPQTITNFSFVSNMPDATTPRPDASAKSKDKIATPLPPAKINPGDQRRVLAVVVDDLGISWDSVNQVKTQMKKMIDELAPNDLMAIIRTGNDVGALQQFTNDKRVLQNSLERLKYNPCSRAGVHVFQRPGELNTDLCSNFVMNRTLDALKFILNGMSLLPGRKSMIVMSDYLPVEDQQPDPYQQTVNTMRQLSVDMNTNPEAPSTDDSPVPATNRNYYSQLHRLAEIAIRSSVVIYGVDTRGLQVTSLTAADSVPFVDGASRRTLTQSADTVRARSDQMISGSEGADLIARQTGGFLIKNSNDFGLKRIMEDQQGFYLIGFRPAEETFNRSFHHLKVKVKRNGLTARTREGFYGFTSDQAQPPMLSTTDAMNKALISPFGAHELSIRLTTFFIDEGKGPMLRSFVYFDPHDLTFGDASGGLRAANVELKAMLFGDNGRVLQQASEQGGIGIRPDAYDDTMRTGITYSFDLPMKASGGVQFRIAVRDVASGRIGSAGQFIDIPNLQNARLAMSGIVVREEKPAATKQALEDATIGPAVRRFHQGATADFTYVIYNANQALRLTSQTRVYRDGKMIFAPDPVAISVPDPTGQQHLATGGRLQLASDMTPGNYVLQIVVTDSSDKQKPRITSQWIDFEIVK